MADGIIEVDDGSFEAEVLKSDTPALVDFWAPWCGPCKAIAPVVEDLAKGFSGKIKFAKCNVDSHDPPRRPAPLGRVKGRPELGRVVGVVLDDHGFSDLLLELEAPARPGVGLDGLVQGRFERFNKMMREFSYKTYCIAK